MSYSAQPQTNITDGLSLLERVLFSSLTTLPSCIVFFINSTMLFTLRSKPMFCETCRYILLCNLLIGDTLYMALSQLLYLLFVCKVTMLYSLCGFLTMLTILIGGISPLTLVLMSLERFVAVCYPLRHASIITARNTALAIALIWAFCSLNVLTRVLLLLQFPFEDLQSLQMTDFCSNVAMFLGPMSDEYDKAFTCVLFVSAGVAITSSYIGVAAAAARSASADKTSARKARNTLLLHLVQLGLSLSSTVNNPLLIALSTTVTRIVFVRVQSALYVFIFILPRCLSALIYGIRDQSIRPVLVYYLCCGPKLSVVTAKAEVSPLHT